MNKNTNTELNAHLTSKKLNFFYPPVIPTMPLLSLADFDKSLKLNQMLLSANLFGTVASAAKQTSYSRYKTELCRQFSENGQCKYGDKCQFAHGPQELKDVKRHPKYKTDFCKTFHSKGFCPYGPRCHFIHELAE
ncbi:zinc finger C3H1 type-like 1, partial [Brachionus plicatilis]